MFVSDTVLVEGELDEILSSGNETDNAGTEADGLGSLFPTAGLEPSGLPA